MSAKVWNLWPVIKASNVTSFFESFSRDNLLFGIHFDKKSNTTFGSHVELYFGFGGRFLETPLQNFLILSSWPIFGPKMKAIAER